MASPRPTAPIPRRVQRPFLCSIVRVQVPLTLALPSFAQAAVAAMAAEEDRRSRMLQALRLAEERRALSVRASPCRSPRCPLRAFFAARREPETERSRWRSELAHTPQPPPLPRSPSGGLEQEVPGRQAGLHRDPGQGGHGVLAVRGRVLQGGHHLRRDDEGRQLCGRAGLHEGRVGPGGPRRGQAAAQGGLGPGSSRALAIRGPRGTAPFSLAPVTRGVCFRLLPSNPRLRARPQIAQKRRWTSLRPRRPRSARRRPPS